MTEQQSDGGFDLVRTVINLGALAVMGALVALVVATIVTAVT
jgi:hypothetical protein